MAAPDTPRKRETSGLLMSIVRTLTSSTANAANREQEKARLEKAYMDSDRRLDKLVEEHLTDMTSIIQAFSTISSRITASQERMRSVKDNLQSCKNLLHCKRDELRKLWIEGIEYKTIVGMLDEIEQVKDVIDQLQSYIDKKQFLHASSLLVKSGSLMEGDLSEVEALRDTRAELQSKKEELYDMLVDELHKQIYIKSTSSIIKGFQRQGSLRQSQRGDKISYLKQALKHAAQQAEAETAAEAALKRVQEVKLEDVASAQEISEDLGVDPERDPVHYIAILVEALAKLKKMPEAIDALRSRLKPGLLAIVQRASQQVADTYYLEGEDISLIYQPQYLLELMELIFKQFRVVARVHQIVLANMSRIKTTRATLGDFCLYDTAEVWIKVQEVLQILLRDYLALRHSSTSSHTAVAAGGDEPVTEMSTFFSKKKPIRKKFPLFRFDASSHAISMSSYLREQRQEFYGSGDILSDADGLPEVGKLMHVCRPCSTNITVIYNPMQKFIHEVEQATRVQFGTSSLHQYVECFIRNVYLGEVMHTISLNIQQATTGYEAQRFTTDLRVQRELGVTKPLLMSTVIVANNVTNLCNLMRDLPDYADQFINMICKILQEYLETCRTAYKNVVMDVEEKRVISATWAKDEDINRLLRSLPNWQSLKEDGDELTMTEEDLRAMNAKESTILTSNLSSMDTFIPQQEIITEVALLRLLGNMCESLEWFSSRILDLMASLKAGNQQLAFLPADITLPKDHPIAVSESTLLTLQSVAQHFLDLSETCLLVLHLEVRVHCFFYLLPLARQHNYSGAIDDMDPDVNVIKLNKGLGAIEEAMNASLQQPKYRYIFEGLGSLVSSILINSTQYFKRINENGIKKMCRNIFAIQQCLTNITLSRETDLDHARQYYELLYLSAEDMLQRIVERGPQFTEHEYINLLNMAHRSERGAKDSALTQRLLSLEQILTEYESPI